MTNFSSFYEFNDCINYIENIFNIQIRKTILINIFLRKALHSHVNQKYMGGIVIWSIKSLSKRIVLQVPKRLLSSSCNIVCYSFLADASRIETFIKSIL